MGRVRLRIRRLECLQDRKITYSKRCPGLIKKAKELSILCDIDIALVMISPTGKSSSFHGERSSPSPEILACQMDLLQLQAKIAAAKNSLSLLHGASIGNLWRTLDQINNVEQLQEIQKSLSESLDHILLLKPNLPGFPPQ